MKIHGIDRSDYIAYSHYVRADGDLDLVSELFVEREYFG